VVDVVDLAAPLRSSTRMRMTAMMSSLVSVPVPFSASRPTRRLNFIRPTADRS